MSCDTSHILLTNMRKQIREPHLTDIVFNGKVFEGRLNWKDWAGVEAGQQLEFYNEVWSSVIVEVVEVRRYADFGAAFDDLLERLLPRVGSAEEAERLYDDYFDRKDVIGHGVVAIGVKVISYQQ